MAHAGGRGGGPLRPLGRSCGTRWCCSPWTWSRSLLRFAGREGCLVVQEAGETQGLGDRIISLAVGECFSALRCAPRLLSAPDVPMPFAPELETCCRPDAAADRGGDWSTHGRSRRWMSRCFACRSICLPKGPPRWRPPSSSGASPRATTSKKATGAGPDRQRQVGVRFRGPLRRPGHPALHMEGETVSLSQPVWRSRPRIRRCGSGFRRRPRRERPPSARRSAPAPAASQSKGSSSSAWAATCRRGWWKTPN